MQKSQFEQRLRELIGTAIGEASLCWTAPPEGAFSSSKASEITDRLTLDVLDEVALYNVNRDPSDVDPDAPCNGNEWQYYTDSEDYGGGTDGNIS